MAVPSLSLSDFRTSNQATLGDGGPWLPDIERGTRSETVCESQKWDWCDGYCLVSAVFPTESRTSYRTSFTTNVSVVMDQYASSDLNFEWNYWPLYCGSKLGTGTNVPMHVQIGTAAFDDNLVTVDYTRFFSGSYPWDPAPKISHSGTTSVTRGSDGTRGFIPITISMNMVPVSSSEYLNLYIKGISFQITSPTQAVPSNGAPTASSGTNTSPSAAISGSASPASSSASGSTSSSPPNSSLSSVPPISLNGIQNTSSSNNSSLEPAIQEPYPPAPKVNTAAVGAAVGSVAFLALLIIILLLWRRRRRQASLNDKAELQPFALSDKAPFELLPSSACPEPLYAMTSRSPSVARSAISMQTSSRPLSSDRSTFFDPPPTYGIEERMARRPTGSPALIEFAMTNRAWISEDLEERLMAAGYLPTDDPDNLTEEEWRDDHGITKLELLRLRSLYARTVQASPIIDPTPQRSFTPSPVFIKDGGRVNETTTSV